jgi:hypothetical protein
VAAEIRETDRTVAIWARARMCNPQAVILMRSS